MGASGYVCAIEHGEYFVGQDSTEKRMTENETNAPAGGGGSPADRASLQLPAELDRAIDLIIDRKGQDLLLLDLRGLSNATDYFLLATGTSDLHVRSIAEYVIDELKKEGKRPNHVEGLRTGRWVLLDFIDFVVHIFHPAAREFYQLERLWGDAPAHTLEA